MRLLLIIILLSGCVVDANAYSINCTYDKGYQVCNGYRLTKAGQIKRKIQLKKQKMEFIKIERERKKNPLRAATSGTGVYFIPNRDDVPLDVSYILDLQSGLYYLNDRARDEYYELRKYIERDVD